MNAKRFISSQELLIDSFKLADQVYRSGFRPHFIVGIWRGGAPIGIAVQEYFDYRQIKTDHIAVRTSSYDMGQPAKEIKVHGLHYLIENANADESLLIVDDVFDSGRSIEALIAQIQKLSRLNTPRDIRIACPWYKPKNTQVDLKPDYFVQESDEWLVFPHEIAGLSADEMVQGKADLAAIRELFI